MAGEMTALNRQGQAKGKKEDKPATAKEIAEAAERRLNKLLISKEAMKENIGHTAGLAIDAAVTVGTAAGSSAVVGMTPTAHRNKVRVVRGLAALGLLAKGLHKGLKYGEGQHYMAAANGLASAEASESAFRFGDAVREKWGWGKGGTGAAEQPPAAQQPPAVQQPAYQPPAAAPAPAIAMTPVQGVGDIREINPADPALVAFRANGRAAAHRR
ncbi:MAG: hypothetical protein JNM72_26455 [Deltaproteobacteria bacterium]|nr:hypothetical protein [Deltaproteobacteria bacterium]